MDKKQEVLMIILHVLSLVYANLYFVSNDLTVQLLIP
jgi:hypothetical protein